VHSRFSVTPAQTPPVVQLAPPAALLLMMCGWATKLNIWLMAVARIQYKPISPGAVMRNSSWMFGSCGPHPSHSAHRRPHERHQQERHHNRQQPLRESFHTVAIMPPMRL